MFQIPVRGRDNPARLQFQFQRKCLAQKQPCATSPCASASRPELHMMPHARHDFFRLFFGKPQPLQNFLRHLRTDFFVAVKMDCHRSWHRAPPSTGFAMSCSSTAHGSDPLAPTGSFSSIQTNMIETRCLPDENPAIARRQSSPPVSAGCVPAIRFRHSNQAARRVWWWK